MEILGTTSLYWPNYVQMYYALMYDRFLFTYVCMLYINLMETDRYHQNYLICISMTMDRTKLDELYLNMNLATIDAK